MELPRLNQVCLIGVLSKYICPVCLSFITKLQDFKLQGSHGAHLLVGQSGIGKNRLVSEFSRLAESEFDCSVLRALCRSDHLMAPFGLMSSVLQELTSECVAGMPIQAHV